MTHQMCRSETLYATTFGFTQGSLKSHSGLSLLLAVSAHCRSRGKRWWRRTVAVYLEHSHSASVLEVWLWRGRIRDREGCRSDVPDRRYLLVSSMSLFKIASFCSHPRSCLALSSLCHDPNVSACIGGLVRYASSDVASPWQLRHVGGCRAVLCSPAMPRRRAAVHGDQQRSKFRPAAAAEARGRFAATRWVQCADMHIKPSVRRSDVLRTSGYPHPFFCLMTSVVSSRLTAATSDHMLHI